MERTDAESQTPHKPVMGVLVCRYHLSGDREGRLIARNNRERNGWDYTFVVENTPIFDSSEVRYGAGHGSSRSAMSTYWNADPGMDKRKVFERALSFYYSLKKGCTDVDSGSTPIDYSPGEQSLADKMSRVNLDTLEDFVITSPFGDLWVSINPERRVLGVFSHRLTDTRMIPPLSGLISDTTEAVVLDVDISGALRDAYRR